MTDKKTGGPAFPCEGGQRVTVGNDLRKTLPSQGMSMRDYFAAKAMQAMITTAGGPCLNGLDGFESHTARAAYRIADAMLESRND